MGLLGSLKGAKGDTGLVANYTVAALKSASNAPDLVFVTDSGKEGFFKYDSTDSVSANDDTICVINGSKRFKRKFDKFLYLTDFGVDKTGVNDSTSAIQYALNVQQLVNKPIIVEAGTYKITATLVKSPSYCGISLIGANNGVIFNYSTIASGLPCLSIIGGSGILCKDVVSNITFTGNANSTAIEIDGQCGQKIDRCIFTDNAIGVRFYNKTAGAFTEWNVISECTFNTSCNTVVRYSQSNGQHSFHGSGLVGTNYISTNSANVIIIDNDCLPYNCPLNAQVWFYNDCNFIANNNSVYNPYFLGNITFERFGGVCTLGTGQKVYFVGGISVLGDFVDSGKLFQCKGVVYNNNSSILPFGLRYNLQKKIVASSTVLADITGCIMQVALQIVGSNYDYSAILTVDSTGTFLNNISSVTFLRTFNGAAYGSPTFSINSSGLLVVTNSKYPTSGANQLTISATYNQIGDFFYGNINKNVV